MVIKRVKSSYYMDLSAVILIDRGELSFLLNDWLDVGRVLEYPRFTHSSREDLEAMLDLVERVAIDEVAPSLRAGDVNPPRLDEGGRVRIDPAVHKAVQAIMATGLQGAVFDLDSDGLQLPFTAYISALAILLAANSSAAFYMMLSIANARLLADQADDSMFAQFGAPQLRGEALGTMCLSESHAGSSLGDILTRATADGADALGSRYRIKGAKMWISGADHDVTKDIVHLVLAKVPQSDGTLPADSRGISLFVVPRVLPSGELNDIVIAGLNHKLGARGMPNCAVNFGEGHTEPDGKAGAVGWLLGEPGQGLALMFSMMNEARVSVGVAAAAKALRGYHHALDYARDRRQGRLPGARGGPQRPIIEHADVRRMLATQKAIGVGSLALVLLAARLQDDVDAAPSPDARREARALLDLLIPIVKSWPSEFGQHALSLAIQVHGGAGYTTDFEVELLYRDNRLNPIHEGTTGIHGIDLVGRKLRRDDGKAYAFLRRRVDETITRAPVALAAEAQALAGAWSAVDAAADLLRAQDDDAAMTYATSFMKAMGQAVVGWIWLDLAGRSLEVLASGAQDAQAAASRSRVAVCRHFHSEELPHVAAWLAPILTQAVSPALIAIEDIIGEAA